MLWGAVRSGAIFFFFFSFGRGRGIVDRQKRILTSLRTASLGCEARDALPAEPSGGGWVDLHGLPPFCYALLGSSGVCTSVELDFIAETSVDECGVDGKEEMEKREDKKKNELKVMALMFCFVVWQYWLFHELCVRVCVVWFLTYDCKVNENTERHCSNSHPL